MATASTDTSQDVTYPPFSGSRYAVTETTRRERWWYADGIWLDQGPTGAVVGFAWTHWLADRGVQLRDGELGENFARELYRETRSAEGEDPDEDLGARLEVAAHVLQSRTPPLVDDCYSFARQEGLIPALLERGPVVAGLTWYESMNEPAHLDGWTVCRVDLDSGIRGGHCVLLNGVTLDTTIDGVRGFVRFKNSWGRAWADGGHALISVEDLAKVMSADSLLPIPAASVLRPGLRQDVAIEGVPYGPGEQVRYEETPIGSDLWTRIDTVGAAAYANAIARGIQHPETKPPLTVGIKAAWGAGKTSLMRMIRDRLEWPGLDGSSDELRAIHLTRPTATRIAVSKEADAEDLGEVTNLTVLRKAKSEERTPPDPRAPKLQAELGAAADSSRPRDEDRWRATVWFNPWMYQTGEQVWAGLAHEIITQITERMSRGEQEHFWLHLNLKRVDEQAVRRKIYALLLNRVVPYAVAGLFVLAAGVVLLAVGGASWLGKTLTALGPAVLLGGTALNAGAVLRSKASAGLADLVQPATSIRRFAGEQLTGAYEQLVENPDYRRQTGSLYLVQADIQRVLDLVATPERPLVIFVDDLDRCSPGTVVQVIEAINLFVAGAYPNSIFVIAMEPEMVAAHVEAVYGDLVQKLEQTSGTGSQAFDLGWRFLEKIVQLPLALPAMEPGRTAAFYESLFPREVAQVTGSVSREDAPLEAQPREVGARGIAVGVRPDETLKTARRPVTERRLSIDDPEVREAIDYASPCLHRNPREIKRFVNLFRFFTMIYDERRAENLPTPASLNDVAKLAVLGIRWPGLLSALALPAGDGGERTVYEVLEDSPGSGRAAARDAALKRALKTAGLTESTVTRLMAPELRAFLRTEPRVGPGVRGYL